MSSANCRCQDTVIHVEGLKVDAYVGLHAPERRVPQTILVDIAYRLTKPEVRGDKISTTADYVPIVEVVQEHAIMGRYRLIETFAERVAEDCFADNRRICEFRITIRKPNKLPNCASVGITRTFTRKETRDA
jgi:dihydroneopterin aldolase